MRSDAPANFGWTFHDGFELAWTQGRLAGEAVELPHNALDLPMSYLDETSYQRPFTYQLSLDWQPAWEGQEVVLLIEGAMADSTAWVNGHEAARHADGYTPFEIRLTPHLTRGTNLVTIRIDGTENPAIPPFGGQIDYLTYAGLYREARLIVRPRLWIDNVKVETPDPLAALKTVRARVWLKGEGAGARVSARLTDATGREVATAEGKVEGHEATLAFDALDLALWSLDAPALHRLDVTLASDAGEDSFGARFGVREAVWTPQGFKLNGEPTKIIGLNRHQSFPYSGYAQGRMSQRRDAEILLELGCNMARTSHYPQSRHFLDACDELGLLVFEEIPGWQHIGDAAWKAASVDNLRAMIRRDWNRPSIVIWGVRINESQDDHDFYAETNRVAREEDPTRQTGGVRYLAGSEMLEDVYTMNDFVLGEHENPANPPGANRPRTALRPLPETTGLAAPVPYLVTEYMGHMFPTKAGDPEARMAEHAMRHLDVLDAMHGDPGVAGAIGWCLFDYNTHKDFGSGDRICHHGVTTIFREPKFAAHAYSSQQPPEKRAVMEPATYFARGERSIGGILPLLILTNCDEVEVRYGPTLRKRIAPDRERFPHLPHPPVILDHRHLTAAEMGAWGMSWEDAEVIGYLAGREVARRRFAAAALPTTLQVAPDATTLDAEARDEVRVILRALDQAGNPLPHLRDAAEITVTGPARLIGPPRAYFAGGTTGFWLRATGGTGEIVVTVATDRFAPVETRLIAI